MKKIWGIGVLAVSCGVGLTLPACSGGSAGSTSPIDDIDHSMEELIGSVAVNSHSLDGIGSIGYVYDYGGYAGAAGAGFAGAPAGGASAAVAPAIANGGFGQLDPSYSSFSAQCTGTLISKNSVLTSRNCGQLFQQGYGPGPLKFAIGADPTQAPRLIDVVDVEFAPANGPYSHSDIAVLHLGESVTDVAVFPVALLTQDLVGKPLAAVGYGNSDLRYQSGTRRAGSLTVRGTSGLLYPPIFGSFDAFYTYETSYGYPGPWYGAGEVTGGAPSVGAGGAAGGLPSAGAAGAVIGVAGEGGDGNGNGDDWYRQFLQQQYDTTRLAKGEAYLGGTDSDAQPCGSDQGGPVVRKQQGQVRVFGVFSHTPFGGCEKGGVYASIDAASKAFIDAAAQWKDPCTGLTGNGKCTGTTATRCSSFTEGKRRAVKLDCALLNQVCIGGGATEVACSDKP